MITEYVRFHMKFYTNWTRLLPAGLWRNWWKVRRCFEVKFWQRPCQSRWNQIFCIRIGVDVWIRMIDHTWVLFVFAFAGTSAWAESALSRAWEASACLSTSRSISSTKRTKLKFFFYENRNLVRILLDLVKFGIFIAHFRRLPVLLAPQNLVFLAFQVSKNFSWNF